MTVTYIIVRCISFITLASGWYFDVWWIGIPLMLWHCYHYRAYELMVLGVLIDIQFLVLYSVPWYTIGFTLVFAAGEYIKPLMRHADRTLL